MKKYVEQRLLKIARRKVAKQAEYFYKMGWGACNVVYLTPIEIKLLMEHNLMESTSISLNVLVKQLIEAGDCKPIRFEFKSKEKEAQDRRDYERLLKILYKHKIKK